MGCLFVGGVLFIFMVFEVVKFFGMFFIRGEDLLYDL